MAVRLSALRTGRCFTPQKHYFYASDTHFCKRLSKPQGLMGPEGLGKLIKIIPLIGSRTRDLPVGSGVDIYTPMEWALLFFFLSSTYFTTSHTSLTLRSWTGAEMLLEFRLHRNRHIAWSHIKRLPFILLNTNENVPLKFNGEWFHEYHKPSTSFFFPFFILSFRTFISLLPHFI
jgi:hypothetical protein